MVLLMPRRILQHSGLKLDIHQLHQKVVSTHLTAARVTWFFFFVNPKKTQSSENHPPQWPISLNCVRAMWWELLAITGILQAEIATAAYILYLWQHLQFLFQLNSKHRRGAAIKVVTFMQRLKTTYLARVEALTQRPKRHTIDERKPPNPKPRTPTLNPKPQTLNLRP